MSISILCEIEVLDMFRVI